MSPATFGCVLVVRWVPEARRRVPGTDGGTPTPSIEGRREVPLLCRGEISALEPEVGLLNGAARPTAAIVSKLRKQQIPTRRIRSLSAWSPATGGYRPSGRSFLSGPCFCASNVQSATTSVQDTGRPIAHYLRESARAALCRERTGLKLRVVVDEGRREVVSPAEWAESRSLGRTASIRQVLGQPSENKTALLTKLGR